MPKSKIAAMKRSLYQLSNARVRVDKIYSTEGWLLGIRKGRTLEVLRLIDVHPFVRSECRGRTDFVL